MTTRSRAILERQSTLPTKPVGRLKLVQRRPEAVSGTRPQPAMAAVVQEAGLAVDLELSNSGTEATYLTVFRHHLAQAPERHDLMPGQSTTICVPAPSGDYDIAVHGPNGFMRAVTGDMASTLAGFDAVLTVTGPAATPGLSLQLHNADRVTRVLKVSSRTGPQTTYRLEPRGSQEIRFQSLVQDRGYYDFTVTVEGVSTFARRFAGHLELGRPAAAR